MQNINRVSDLEVVKFIFRGFELRLHISGHFHALFEYKCDPVLYVCLIF